MLLSRVDCASGSLCQASCSKRVEHCLRSTSLSQLAIFSLEYALSEMWKARGLQPFAVLGHSVSWLNSSKSVGRDGLSQDRGKNAAGSFMRN